MKKEVCAILAILGTIMGSGFVSGKEIIVFFSRFGIWSFLGIFCAFFCLFFLINFILNNCLSAMEKLSKSKFAYFINIILCVIFSSAMFGGIINLLNFRNNLINFVIFCVILLILFIIFKKGAKFLDKLNLIFVPVLIILFVCLLFSKLQKPYLNFSFSLSGISVFYSLLYCLLNTSNGAVIIAQIGDRLSKKQKTRVAFVSALVLSIVLLIANIVVLANPSCIHSVMPLLSLFEGGGGVIMQILVLIGCMTTLFSLVYSSSSSIRGLCKNEVLNFLVSIVLPALVSLIGFDEIIEHLYPLASILGGALLIDLFFVSFFKRAYKKVHSSRK